MMTNTKDVRAQIVEWAKSDGVITRPYLLIHADDGVIWGYISEKGLKISGEAFPKAVNVKLRWETIQQLRLFGEQDELFTWRTQHGLNKPILKTDDPDQEQIDERVLLWGEVIDTNDGFSLCYEGEQGLVHAPPYPAEEGEAIYLIMRQSIGYDNDGQLQVTNSRLVDLQEAAGR